MFKVSIKTPERHQWRSSGAFIVNFEHICSSVSIVNFEHVIVDWEFLYCYEPNKEYFSKIQKLAICIGGIISFRPLKDNNLEPMYSKPILETCLCLFIIIYWMTTTHFFTMSFTLK